MKEFKVLLTKKIVVTVDAEDERCAELMALDLDMDGAQEAEWSEATPAAEVIGERDIA